MKADVDIDLADREQVLKLIQHVPARQTIDNKVRRHNSGVYITAIPKDPVHGCAAIDYHEAEQRGYFKIDLLNMTVYQLIRDQAHYDELLTQDPPWHRLQEQEFCEKIVHIGNHYDLVKQLQPNSIPRMAMLLAVIRPAKRHLAQGGWPAIAQDIWTRPLDDSYFFKKSHAVGYAQLVALHMNLVHSAD
jgi:hypothetical protein